MADFWDRIARLYERITLKHLSGQYGVLIKRIREEVRGRDTLLEVGTGPGIIALEVADAVGSVVAMDRSGEMIRIAEKRRGEAAVPNIRFEEGDAHRLVYRDESFDAVVASNILHLLPDPGMALNEIVRVMKKGGLVILPTYCHGENRTSLMVSRIMGISGFRAASKWSLAGYGEFVASCGLDIVREDSLGGSIPLSYLSARKKE